MERIHYLIGALIFLVFVFAASANPNDRWYKSPHVAPHYEKVDLRHKIIACTILAEARGEGKAGMYAVASVIEQRSHNRLMAPEKVCFQKLQFSCWNNRKSKSWTLQHDDLMWTAQAPYALALAMKILDGVDNNKEGLKLSWLKNADHYCHVNINNYWTRKNKPVAVVGNHKFFRLTLGTNTK